MKISVIGTGYLGATHAAAWPNSATRSSASTSTRRKVAALARGEVPVLRARAARAAAAQASPPGRLRFTTSYEEAADFGDVHFICVGTPQQPGEYAADMHLRRRGVARPRCRTCAGRASSSASPPCRSAPPRGSRDAVRRAPAGADVELAWNPEFLREGFAVEDTLRPDRLVFGVTVARGARGRLRERLRADHRRRHARSSSPTSPPRSWSRSPRTRSSPPRSRSSTPWPRSARRPAPTSRSWPTRSAHDARIGGRFLHAGLGFGGGCLPKDIRAFMARAGELGVGPGAVVPAARSTRSTMRRRARTVDLAARAAAAGRSPGAGSRVLGAAFKPNSDDVRDSPALDVASPIQRRAAPGHASTTRRRWTTRARDYPDARLRATAVDDAAPDADVVLLLTEWDEFRELDPAVVGEVVAPAAASSTAATPSTRTSGAPAGPTARWAARDSDRAGKRLSCSPSGTGPIRATSREHRSFSRGWHLLLLRRRATVARAVQTARRRQWRSAQKPGRVGGLWLLGTATWPRSSPASPDGRHARTQPTG